MSAAVADLPPLIGQSRPFLDLMERVSSLAPLQRPVLVAGERGTGKELVAMRLHYLSDRWNRPLVTLNCAAVPESLFEAELFGHEPGAFTGAIRRRIGRFEQADGGSLFLDEIANAPLTVQEKILRVVEYGTFERLGSSATQQCDTRLIAAANVDLATEAAAGRFRLDLLDRLAFDVLTLPPLRARADDVPILAAHFARAMAFELGWTAFPGFTAEAMDDLMAYGWLGNIRELKNVVERAVYRWPDPDRPVAAIVFDPFQSPYRLAGAEHTPNHPSSPTAADAAAGEAESMPALPIRLDAVIGAYEARLLSHALQCSRHNQRDAARQLGLSYHQLRGRLKKHGLLHSQAQAADDGA